MKTTVIKFDTVGGISVDATGFTGTACEETTAKLLEGLGSKRMQEIEKPERYATQGQSAKANASRW